MIQSATGAAILIVDDEVSLRNTFRIFLQRAGYETVIAVASPEEAVREVSRQIFDLIICDIVLENQSGIDLFKRFRKLGVNCPVVIITGFPHVETASEAVRLGAFDYLSKPIEKDTLLKTVRLAISHYHLEQEKQEAERAREQYRSFLETIFKSVSDGIVSVDQQMKVMQVNQAAATLFQEVGLYICEGDGFDSVLLRRPVLAQITEKVAEVLNKGTELTDHRVECFLDDDRKKLLSICISPLHTGEKNAPGAVLVFRDITRKELVLPQKRTRFHQLIGASPPMQNVYLLVENIGRVDTTVLITGASGTGKELVAGAIHKESSRRNRPLVMVDCTTIQDTLLESELFGHKKGAFTGANETRDGRILQADGGTLFLDEIGDISKTMQLRLLRFLQEKTFYPVGSDRKVQVDVRVVAATNVDLKKKVARGEFREDLYFRLLVIDINLPLLKDRKEDIELLTHHFITRYAQKVHKNITGISEQALELLGGYHWPGNVRQLKHFIERACILCHDTTISTEHLPQEIAGETIPANINPLSSADDDKTADLVEQADDNSRQQLTGEIVNALRRAGGNKAKAARILNVNRSTLYRKMRELHIDIDLFSG
ncbi:sigma-54 dependent transcriptional regulator [Desulforhopalus singaporensis]|nr:sigma-54 dependent transcriptional regulator [Desulforhopalus singaporensis]